MKFRVSYENDRFFIGTKPKKEIFIDCMGLWFKDDSWSINQIKHCNEPQLIKTLNTFKLIGFERSKLIHSQELAGIMSNGLEYDIPNGVMIRIAIVYGLPTYYDDDLEVDPEQRPFDYHGGVCSAWIDLSFDENRCNFAN